MVPQEPIDVLEGTGAEETFEAEFGNIERRYDEDADSTNAGALCTEEQPCPSMQSPWRRIRKATL